MQRPGITKDLLEKIKELRYELHKNPELSGEEVWTRQFLMTFLKQNTSLEVMDMGSWFYARKKGKTEDDAIAFRADFDALPILENMEIPYCSQKPGVSHKCGHDGHSAALCGLGMVLDQTEVERSVYLIFQPAEEIGEGGAICAEFLQARPIREVYAWHNRSGYPLHEIIVKAGPIQCASRGLTVFFTGIQSHASEPEKGNNPAFAIGEVLQKVSEISFTDFCGRTLYTVIHVNVGTKDFGVSPGQGEISFTLRADYQQDLEKLEKQIRCMAETAAQESGLHVEYEIRDPFPMTANDPDCAGKIMKAAVTEGFKLHVLDSPWRASEDFGYYTMVCPGAMFFIGTGEDRKPLHTVNYDFNDEILETAIRMMFTLI